jgi:DnaJ family protein C protein 13
MASAHSDLDDAGEIVTPTPMVKRILSSPRCLPHVAQVLYSLKFVVFLISRNYFVVILFIFLVYHTCA